jgi:hypothetical protein
MKFKKESKNKLRLLVKFLIYSLIYGLFFINIIDINIRSFFWYHWVLIFLEFLPFLVICLILGWKNWDLFLALGLLSSLMNDLFYAPMSNYFFGGSYNLSEWFLQQLGFRGNIVIYHFQGGFFTFPVTSWLMGLSIYLRIVLIFFLLRNWLSKE